MKSRNPETDNLNQCILLKFESSLGSSAAEMIVKFQTQIWMLQDFATSYRKQSYL